MVKLQNFQKIKLFKTAITNFFTETFKLVKI